MKKPGIRIRNGRASGPAVFFLHSLYQPALLTLQGSPLRFGVPYSFPSLPTDVSMLKFDFCQSYWVSGRALGEPPAVGGAEHPGIKRLGEIGHLGDLPVGGLDEDRIAFLDVVLARRLRVDLQPRVGIELPELFDPAIRGMEEVAALGARQDERVRLSPPPRAVPCRPAAARA